MTQSPIDLISCVAETAEGFMALDWFEPFNLGTEAAISALLPVAIPAASEPDSMLAKGVYARHAMALPGDAPRGRVLQWPFPRCGIAFAIGVEAGRNSMIGMWPFFADGVEHEFMLERIETSPERLRGILIGAVGEMSVSFFATRYIEERPLYAADRQFNVVLSALALDLDVTPLAPLRIDARSLPYDAEMVFGREHMDPDGMVTIQTDGIAAFLSVPELPMGFYSLAGTVRDVSPYPEMLGVKVWRLRVTAARLAGGDFDLDLFVTSVTLGGQPVLVAGQSLTATAWLQGYISSIE